MSTDKAFAGETPRVQRIANEDRASKNLIGAMGE
jgi:hypothetical protein